VGGQCKCNTQFGIVGDATTQSKCGCPSPYQVYYNQQSQAYCIQYQDAANYKTDNERDLILTTIAQTVYLSLIWPTPYAIMQAVIAGVPSPVAQYFIPTAKGRVDPLGEYFDQDGIVEYFYGTVWTGASRVSEVVFQKIVVTGNIVAVRVRILINNYNQDQSAILYSYNLTQTTMFTFTENNLISSLEAIIHNLAWNSDPQTPKSTQVAQLFCGAILYQCNASNDPDGYYTDMNDCVDHFLNVYQWGTWGYMRSNTSVCRIFHSLLAIGRPSIHCVHTGKTGGGKCTDHIYSEYYNEDF